MAEEEFLAEQFRSSQAHLQAVAYRMLGSRTEADDAVQEAWLRLSRSDRSDVENLTGWLTTVVARVCLDMLRSRKARREEILDEHTPEPMVTEETGVDPEHEMLMADSVGLALLVVLEKLAPAERVAFVLHDMFDLPFEEIAPIVGRSPVAARQLASRARRRVQGTDAVIETDRTRQREVVDAFLAASRGGDFNALLAVLDPDVVFRADRVALELSAARQEEGAPILAPEVRGAAAVAEAFRGRATGAQPALVDGAMSLVWAPGGEPRAVFGLTIARGRIVAIDLVADPERIGGMDVEILNE